MLSNSRSTKDITNILNQCNNTCIKIIYCLLGLKEIFQPILYLRKNSNILPVQKITYYNTWVDDPMYTFISMQVGIIV